MGQASVDPPGHASDAEQRPALGPAELEAERDRPGVKPDPDEPVARSVEIDGLEPAVHEAEGEDLAALVEVEPALRGLEAPAQAHRRRVEVIADPGFELESHRLTYRLVELLGVFGAFLRGFAALRFLAAAALVSAGPLPNVRTSSSEWVSGMPSGPTMRPRPMMSPSFPGVAAPRLTAGSGDGTSKALGDFFSFFLGIGLPPGAAGRFSAGYDVAENLG